MKAGARMAVYLRVSTLEQSLSQQIRGLRELAELRHWRIVAVYRERKSTRRALPQLERLVAAAMLRKYDAILIWRLDRLGRSLVELVGIVERLVERGVAVVSVKDGALDTSSAAAKLQLAILAAAAEFEREVLRERTREGLARVRAKGSKSGKPIGRPRVDAAQLGAALAWLHQKRESQRAEGFADRALASLNVAADRHGISRSTLRRFARARNTSADRGKNV